MPNWSKNKVTIVGPQADIDAFAWKARGYRPRFKLSEMELRFAMGKEPEEEAPMEEFSFHALIPIPAETLAQTYDPAGIDAERALWSLKWGACDPAKPVRVSPTELLYEFDTAWTPPFAFLLRVSASFPSLSFLCSFAEEYPTRGYAIFAHGGIRCRVDESSNDDPAYPEFDEEQDREDPTYDARHHESSQAWRFKYHADHAAMVARYVGSSPDISITENGIFD